MIERDPYFGARDEDDAIRQFLKHPFLNMRHHGIGHYWCDNCRQWVWGASGRSYIDIIEVHRDRNVAYTAYQSGIPDKHGHHTWETNSEFPLDEIEADLGYQLREGRQDPWIRLWWSR